MGLNKNYVQSGVYKKADIKGIGKPVLVYRTFWGKKKIKMNKKTINRIEVTDRTSDLGFTLHTITVFWKDGQSSSILLDNFYYQQLVTELS